VVRISLIGESEGAISWMYRVYHVAQAAVTSRSFGRVDALLRGWRWSSWVTIVDM
jgi:hypothetical protein